MALIQCPDCGRDVSTLATACPNCGRPVDQTMAAVTSGKRIACPDGSCTGIIKENGQCGTCGKSSNWRDSPRDLSAAAEDYTKTVAYQVGKGWATNKPGMIFLV